MNFTDFLKWLTSSEGGALLIVMWGVSWGLETMTWWSAIASKARAIIILATSVALGLFGVWAQSWPPETIAAIEPYFRATTTIVLLWLGSQVVHKIDKKLS